MTPWILSIVVAIAIALLVAEVKGGLHALARRISVRAAKTLPEAHVERWREEWASDLEGYRDRPISGLMRALKFRRDAREMRRDLRGMPTYSRSSVALKRIIDIAVAAVLLIIAAPLLAVSMLAIKIETPGPATFRARRIGLWGNVVTLVRLRTMVDPAPQATVPAIGPLRPEPRVTRVGRFLLRTHLDHLPTLFSVLRGDLSLVGPPLRFPLDVEEEEEVYLDYQSGPIVKPGLTGLSQLADFESNYSAALHDLRLLDEDYVQSWSVLGDLKILLRTVWQVFTGR